MTLDKLAKDECWPEYKELPAACSQQTSRFLEKNWKSFFQAVKQYVKAPELFLGRPRLPDYKHTLMYSQMG